MYKKNRLLVRQHRLIDMILTVISFICAFYIKKYILPEPFRGLTTVPNYHTVLLIIVIIWYLSFNFFDFYVSYKKQTLTQIYFNLIKAIFVSMVLLSFSMYFLKITDVSRIMMSIFSILNIGLLGLSKYFIYRNINKITKNGFKLHQVLIVGSKSRANEIIREIKNHGKNEYKIIGCMDVDATKIGMKLEDDIEVIDNVLNLEKVIMQHVIDELIFAIPLNMVEDLEKYISIAENIGIKIRILPNWEIQKLGYSPSIGALDYEKFHNIPTMTISTTPKDNRALFIKSTLDYVFSIIILFLCLPLFAVIPILIKISSKGPVFFKQRRMGLNGRIFTFYKFRTMVHNANELQQKLMDSNQADGPVFKIKNDPRIILFIGTFLRKTNLDELPQLINVLKGEMSIVGPRPPIPSEVKKYDMWHRRRLSMKPGMTCIWQTTPNRNNMTFKEWIELDLKYIDNWSLDLDFKILLKTILTVLKGSGY